MSGFEHYQQEIDTLDREIRHYAAVCRVSPENRGEMEVFLRQQQESPIANQARDTLRGLLALRLQLETEMLEFGQVAPPLTTQSPSD